MVSARATLVQVHNMLVTPSDEGARRLRQAQVAFITTCRERSSSTSASHESDHECHAPDVQVSGRQSVATERIQVSDIPSRKLPFEVAYGGMLSRDDNEWAGLNSILVYG